MIIGIVGQIGSGKGTVADYLAQDKDFVHLSFASSLKDSISAIFGWDRAMLEGSSIESRIFREQVDEWWATRLGIPHLTPRWILQHWGTNLCRDKFHDEIWVASLEHKLQSIDGNVVISDCRYPNEFAAIKRAGGKIIRIKRGDEPSWYDTALLAISDSPDAYQAREQLQSLGIHSSEWEWYNLVFDTIVENDSTINELHSTIDLYVTSLDTGLLASK